MLRSLLLLGAATLAVAQGSTVTSYSESAAPTATATNTSSQPVTHTIAVAKGGFTFQPDVTLAEVGDIIEFDFYPLNHSVIRSEYGYPCIPYEDTGVDKIGFFSGFRPVDAVLANPPTYTIRINDSNPVFFYCGAQGSCIDHQMVGVINPNATTSLVTQKNLAGQSTFMLLPGQPWPSEQQDPFTTTAASTSSTAAATSTRATAPAATTTTAAPVSGGHSGLSAGAIAGIAIGAAAVALIAAVLLYLCGRHSHKNTQPAMQQPVPFSPAHGSVSYNDPSKHMSMQSSFVSQALPGYVPTHDPAMSPQLHPSYAASDALNPGSDINTPASPSPSQIYAAPAYSNMHPHSMQSTPHQSGIYAAAPPHGVHEMAAPGADGQQQGGIMNFIRKSSVSKTGGVERYG